jgi:cobaltochelatase CobN
MTAQFRFRALRADGADRAPARPGLRENDRKASYHDPDQPPCHAYLAFYLGLRAAERSTR